MADVKVFRYRFDFLPSGTKIVRQGKSRRGGYYTLDETVVPGDLRRDKARASKMASALGLEKAPIRINTP